jgi:hypothetical protein
MLDTSERSGALAKELGEVALQASSTIASALAKGICEGATPEIIEQAEGAYVWPRLSQSRGCLPRQQGRLANCFNGTANLNGPSAIFIKGSNSRARRTRALFLDRVYSLSGSYRCPAANTNRPLFGISS